MKQYQMAEYVYEEIRQRGKIGARVPDIRDLLWDRQIKVSQSDVSNFVELLIEECKVVRARRAVWTCYVSLEAWMIDLNVVEELMGLLKKETTEVQLPDTLWPEVHVRFTSNMKDARRFYELLGKLI